MSIEMYKRFTVDQGLWDDFDEYENEINIEGFPIQDPDIILVDGKKVASFLESNYSIEFYTPTCKKYFDNALKETGLLSYIKEELNVEEVSESLAALIIKTRTFDNVDGYYKYKKENENMLLSFVDDLINK